MNAPRDHTAWLQGREAVCRNPPGRPDQPRRIVLLGSPGIGKGTQAGLLGAALGACHLSTTEILRTAGPAASDDLSPALRIALDYLRRGETVPEEALLGLIDERSRCLHCAGGFVLDGFPRTARQAEALDLLLKADGLALDAVVLYGMPVPSNVLRLLGRRICPDCQRSYHIKDRPPRVTGVCDDCQARLVQLRDDRIDAIRLLQGSYAVIPRELIAYYQRRGLLVTVDACGTPEETFMRTIDALKAITTVHPAWNTTTLVPPGAGLPATSTSNAGG